MGNIIVDSFIKNHGKDAYINIAKKIKQELDNSNLNIIFDDNYINYIFEYATYLYCGIDNDKINLIIDKMGNCKIPNINNLNITNTHKSSLDLIINLFKNK